MSVEFKSFKKQYLEQGKLHDETSKALNAKSSQLETMSQDLVATRQELRTNQHMVTELQNELAAAKAQVNLLCTISLLRPLSEVSKFHKLIWQLRLKTEFLKLF